MTYIGFSTKTHKISARILCHHFKHCAPIVAKYGKYYLYQFTNRNNINVITLKHRDLLILKQYGWVFIEHKGKINSGNTNALTCVQFTKQFCCINNRKIITPDDLFRYLTK
jgi:hypothetical protein